MAGVISFKASVYGKHIRWAQVSIQRLGASNNAFSLKLIRHYCHRIRSRQLLGKERIVVKKLKLKKMDKATH